MSDVREDVVRKFSTYLVDFSSENARKLIDALSIVLDDYEVSVRTTEVGFYDDSNINLLKQFIASKSIEGCSDGTIRQYIREIQNFDNEIQRNFNEVSFANIRNYLAKKKINGCKDTTLRNSRNYLSSFFGWLHNNGLIDKNPMCAVSPIKCAKVERKSYSDTDMIHIKENCDNPRDKALIEFLSTTGCRISEVCSLDRGDIDFIQKSLIVRGKGNKDRVVYFNEVCSLRLMEYLESREDNCEALFVTNRQPCKRLQTSSIRKMLTRMGVKCDIDDLHPHRFRRTFATSLIDKGMGIHQVSMLLGHESVSTTQIYYDHSRADVQNNYNKYMRI